MTGTYYVPGAVRRAGCSGKRKQGRIWDGLGYFRPGYQHVSAALPQGGVVQQVANNQRTLPVNVEEV